MDPITFTIGVLFGLVVTLDLIYLACLYFSRIVNWFRNREYLMDKHKVAFSIQERLRDGNFKTYYGIFNKRTSEIEVGEAVKSNEIDEQLAELHLGRALVIYK